MTEVSEREAIVAWLNGEPFPWREATFWERARAAWHLFRGGNNVMFGMFRILAHKIERGDHLNPENTND